MSHITLQNKLQLLITEADKKQIVVLGAARGGWYTSQVLSRYGLQIKAFIDNNPIKHGSIYLGVPVLSASNAITAYPNAIFIPALLNPDNLASSIRTLHAPETLDIRYIMPSILYSFFTEIVQRQCDPHALARTIDIFFNRTPGRMPCISPSLSCVITQKCTLRCKNCGAFVPENASPITFPFERIVDDIRKYCSAFDLVHHIAIQGGEPFLHRHIKEILNGIASIPNLLFVDFVTNGTIVPRSIDLDAIAQIGGGVIISDYGAASKKITQVANCCKKHNIFTDYYRYSGDDWYVCTTPIYANQRDISQNDLIFQTCIANSRVCCQIMNGKLHRCSFSNFTEHLNLTPVFMEDFVNLQKHEISDHELSSQIRFLANRNAALMVCDYCPIEHGARTSAGIQLPLKNKIQGAPPQ